MLCKALGVSYIHTYTQFDLSGSFHMQNLYTERLCKASRGFAHTEGALYTHIFIFQSFFLLEMWRHFTKPLYRGDLA